MRLIICIFFLYLALIKCFSQSDTLITYYPYTSTIETLIAPLDTTIKDSTSDSYYGSWNNKIDLNLRLPDSILQLNLFTNNKFASEDFNMLSFPIRANVGLFHYGYTSNTHPYGSGIMISPNAILTAGHLICEEVNNDHFGNILRWKDSIVICPAFTDGNPQPEIGVFKVRKCYLFKDYVNNYGKHETDDIAILILDEPIGYKIGWFGTGFSVCEEFFLNKVFFNFSYPGTDGYDGHNMVYKYGKFMYSSNYFSSNNVVGIPGESGSGFFYTNNINHIVYGIRITTGTYLLITKKTFNIINRIINENLPYYLPYFSNIENINNTDKFVLYPNPAKSILNIKLNNFADRNFITIFDLNGKAIITFVLNNSEINTIDISNLSSGFYIIELKNNNLKLRRKIIKL